MSNLACDHHAGTPCIVSGLPYRQMCCIIPFMIKFCILIILQWLHWSYTALRHLCTHTHTLASSVELCKMFSHPFQPHCFIVGTEMSGLCPDRTITIYMYKRIFASHVERAMNKAAITTIINVTQRLTSIAIHNNSCQTFQ